MKGRHDQRLITVLKTLEDAGVTLNKDKYQFAKTTVKVLGHVIGPEGIRPDPDKVQAICSMMNQLSKFSSRLADLSEPVQTSVKYLVLDWKPSESL